MLRKQKEGIRAAEHRDAVLLVKEYARIGYKQSLSNTDKGFEKIWQRAFRITESETVIPAKP
jgi:hypothetical protein